MNKPDSRLEAADAKHLLDQFNVNQAAKLARSGNYSAAESLLKEPAQREHVPALDLLARVYAQQGRLEDAAALWNRALKVEPANTACQRALDRVYRMRQRKAWAGAAWPIALIVIGAILCFVLVQLQFYRQRVRLDQLLHLASHVSSDHGITNDLASAAGIPGQLDSIIKNQITLSNEQSELARKIDTRPRELPPANQGFESITKRLDERDRKLASAMDTIQKTGADFAADNRENRERLDQLAGAVSNLAAAKSAGRRPPNQATTGSWPSIEAPGIHQVAKDATLKISFDEGLFDHGVHFKPGAKERLGVALRNLAQSKDDFRIEAVGYSDSDRDFFGPADSYSLGLARAAAVVKFIRETSLFDPNHLSASSSGSMNLPVQGVSPADHARNRTAVIVISR